MLGAMKHPRPPETGADARLAADARLDECACCPRACGARRRAGERGFCGALAGAEVASVVLHCGEEPAISGARGIANVFFAGCNLVCAYCQNRQISRPGARAARFDSLDDVADEVLRLLDAGATGVGFVSTAHVAPQVEALAGALRARGATVPFVLNTNAYESADSLARMAPLVDVWLPDLKYMDAALAARLSGTADYPEVATAALRAMHARVGDRLDLDDSGLARRGLVVRHLVLPGEVENSLACLRWLARELSPGVAVSLMAQYAPTPEVAGDARLGRRVTKGEYAAVVAEAARLGLGNGWVQDLASADAFNPDFDAPEPFG